MFCGVGHLRLVVVRRANHGDVVSEGGGVLSEAQGLDGRFDAGAGDHDLLWRSSVDGGLENLALLVSGEKYGFAGGAEDDDSRGRRTGIVLDVLLELAMVDGAVRVERCRDGRIDSVKKHRSVSSSQ